MRESKEQKKQCQLQAKTYEENNVSKREVGPMTRNKDTESHQRMATEQEWKVAEKERDHLVEIEEEFVVDKQKSRRVEWQVTQKQQEEQQTISDRLRSQVDSRDGFRRTKNMIWSLRSRKLSKLRKKPSQQLRLLTQRNKLHTNKAGQRAARVVREGIRREIGS